MHSAAYYADYATNNWKESIVRLMKPCTNNSIIVDYLRSAHGRAMVRRYWHRIETSALKMKKKALGRASIYRFTSTNAFKKKFRLIPSIPYSLLKKTCTFSVILLRVCLVILRSLIRMSTSWVDEVLLREQYNEQVVVFADVYVIVVLLYRFLDTISWKITS